jgi:23S rRNA (uracil1939-C5)-methyltransferase
MQLCKGQIIELDIHDIAFGGAGIGKYEGMTVFVEGTMVGDRVKASFTRIKPKFAEGKLVEVVKPSSEREKPKCPYFGVCGGCQFQFMPYEKQLEFKKQHVIDAFERIGKIYNPPVCDVLGCNDPFYYRNKMEFSFGYDSDMNFALGLHLPGRRYDILNLKECFLQSEFSSQLLNKVREFVVEKNWQPFKFSCGEGFLRSIYIREGKRTGEVMINLCTSDEFPPDIEKDMAEFAKSISSIDGKDKKIISIYWSKIISKRDFKKRIEETLLFGKKTITEKMILENGDNLSFEILPQAFFQVNTFQAETLYSQILKLASLNSHKVVFDLFCGTGTIGLFLSKHCEQVYGIELNEDAIKSAHKNAERNKIFNVDFYTGDVTKILKNLKNKPSLVVVDPPRSGLTEKTIKQINDFDVSQLIYVSCNPSTLARDCNLFSAYGYKVKSIQPVDMFPHTYHIENVCLLER